MNRYTRGIELADSLTLDARRQRARQLPLSPAIESDLRRRRRERHAALLHRALRPVLGVLIFFATLAGAVALLTIR